MKKIILTLSIFITFLVCGCQNDKNQEVAGTTATEQQPVLKRYNVKSGIVKYQTKINGKVMGSTITGTGTEELYFKNWGSLELKKADEKKVTHINMFGQKKTDVDETHTIDKLDNGKSYHVDVKNKTIYVRNDPAMEMMKTFNNGEVAQASEKMLESMGGKKIGKEKVLGYNCDVWEIAGGKQWIYKGVPLKLQMTMMGITTTNEATSAKFDTNVPDKYFKLPDYPIQKLEGFGNDKMSKDDRKEMKKSAAKIKNMSFDQYKQMLKQNKPETYKNMSEADLKTSYQLMKKMAAQMAK